MLMNKRYLEVNVDERWSDLNLEEITTSAHEIASEELERYRKALLDVFEMNDLKRKAVMGEGYIFFSDILRMSPEEFLHKMDDYKKQQLSVGEIWEGDDCHQIIVDLPDNFVIFYSLHNKEGSFMKMSKDVFTKVYIKTDEKCETIVSFYKELKTRGLINGNY